MNRTRTLPALFLTSLAALTGACSDDGPSAPPVAPVQGAPIDGAPIDGGPAAPPAPQQPTVDAPATSDEPPIGDVSPPGERSPEDSAVTTTPAARDPAGAKPVPPDPPAPTPTPTETPPPTPTAIEPAPTDVPEPATTADPSLPGVATAAGAQAGKTDLPEKPAAADPEGAAKPGAAKSFVPKDKKKADVIELTWDELASFEFVAPPPVYSDPETGVFPDQTVAIEKATKQIPAEIWELEGQTISVEGYMIPLEYAEEGVRSFLISRHAMGCCFGVMPRPHELVECDMGDAKAPPYVGYLPVKVTGTLHVGLKHGPNTVLSGIYRMDAPKVTVSKER